MQFTFFLSESDKYKSASSIKLIIFYILRARNIRAMFATVNADMANLSITSKCLAGTYEAIIKVILSAKAINTEDLQDLGGWRKYYLVTLFSRKPL
jgi:hypothetical protein